ncbi:MAG: branched-chain amino acid ABC transporter permease [Acidimicrobiia bacterium]
MKAAEAGARDARKLRPGVYRRHQYLLVTAFVVATAVLAPTLAHSRSSQYNVNLWLVYSIGGIGFYWVFGLAGRFAFCQAFMMALGGYMGAWTARSSIGGGFPVQLLLAMLVSATLAAVIGLLVRKAQALYFAIATIAVVEMGSVFFRNAEWFTGHNGLTIGIPPIHVFGRDFIAEDEVFRVFLGALAVVLLLAVLIERSPLRRDAVAARDNPMVAAVSGVPAVRAQIVLFALGSAMGGLAGALMGPWTGTTSNAAFGIDLAIGMFLMLILGGIGSMWGPVVGAAFYVAVPDLLSSLEQYSTIVYGALLLVVIIAMPEGIVGALMRLRWWLERRWRLIRSGSSVDAAG